ncbi:MAG: hypothetical protein NVS4B2_08670 [Chloroflexota bacterium]
MPGPDRESLLTLACYRANEVARPTSDSSLTSRLVWFGTVVAPMVSTLGAVDGARMVLSATDISTETMRIA